MMCAIQTQAEAVCGLFDGKKEEIKVIGIRYDEKMYEILLINKKCAKVVDMDDFYCVLADNRGLNYGNILKKTTGNVTLLQSLIPTIHVD